MFRFIFASSRSSIRRPQNPYLLNELSFHSSAIFKSTNKDLYSELLADINASQPPRKRTRKKISQLDGFLTSKEIPKVSTKSTSKKPSRKKPAQAADIPDEAAADTASTKRKIRTKVVPVEASPAELSKPKARGQDTKRQKVPLALLKNPWDDVTRYLKSAYGSKKTVGDKRRAHMISESLCDDALQRLEPTLEPHVGCDIIDINPGVCLWSRKLHERLKPRKHILLEPDTTLYGPFLLPLTEPHDSKYELIPKSGIVWSHLETALTKESLPHQKQLQRGDPELNEKNDTLLVLANLGYYPMKPYRGFNSLASLVLYQFMSATRTHSLFQRYGRVRFMVWTNDEEKRHLLPREIHQRRKQAVEAELTFEKLNEVASTTIDNSVFQRNSSYDEERGKEVLQKMQQAGIKTPPGRESVLLQQLVNVRKESPTEGVEGYWGMGKESVEELIALEKAFKAGEYPKRIEIEGKMKPNPKYQRYRYLWRQRKFVTGSLDRFAAMEREHDALVGRHKDLHELKSKGTDTTEAEADFKKTVQAWYDEIDLLSDGQRDRMAYLLDNRRSVGHPSPLLMYDRRDYEPLLVQKEEFFPAHPMCLLDFQPGQMWSILREGDRHNQDVFDYLLGSFFQSPTQSVEKALKATWPGAYEWIIESCPSLTDPTKGAALNLDKLTVRTLNEDMLREIITAWLEWPFRPSRHELVSRMGAAGYDPDEQEID